MHLKVALEKIEYVKGISNMLCVCEENTGSF